MNAFDVRDHIFQEITAIDSQLDPLRVTEPFEHSIRHIEKVYDELTRIHQQRERYNVHWAFSYAVEQIQNIISGVFTKQLKQKISDYSHTFKNRKKKDTIEQRFAVIQRALTDKIDKTRTSPIRFRAAEALMLAAELLFTLVIVLTAAQTLRFIDRTITIPQLSLLFAAVFGLLRLVLYRTKTRFLGNWSWLLYQDAVDSAFDGLAIVLATSYVLAYHVKRGIFLETKLQSLLSRSLRRLQEPPEKNIRRYRKAQHLSARLRSIELEKIQRFRYRMEYLALDQAFTLDAPRQHGKRRIPRGVKPYPLSAEPPQRKGRDEPAALRELPEGESLLTEESLQVLKKRTRKLMDYLNRKFSNPQRK